MAKTLCFENCSSEATLFCLNCSKDFCEKCFSNIHRFKSQSHHEKCPVAEKPIQLPKCSKHEYNFAEFLCIDPACEIECKTMCNTCRATEHMDHSFDFLLEKIEKTREDGLKITEKIDERELKIKKIHEERREILKSYDMESQEYQQKIGEISYYFDLKKYEAIQKFDKFVEETRKKIRRTNKKQWEEKEKTKNLKEMVESVAMSNEIEKIEGLETVKEGLWNFCDELVDYKIYPSLDKLHIFWKDGTDLCLWSDCTEEPVWWMYHQ